MATNGGCRAGRSWVGCVGREDDGPFLSLPRVATDHGMRVDWGRWARQEPKIDRSIALLLLAAVVPLMPPLPAFADPFCDTLKTIIAAGDEETAFGSLNMHAPDAAGRMIGSAAFAGFACTVDPDPDKARTFYSCKAATTTDGATRQVDPATQAGACLSKPVQTTASRRDSFSSLVVDGKRQTTVAVGWWASLNSLTINTFAADK